MLISLPATGYLVLACTDERSCDQCDDTADLLITAAGVRTPRRRR